MNPLVRWFHQLGSPPTFDRFAARWSRVFYLAAVPVLLVGGGLALVAAAMTKLFLFDLGTLNGMFRVAVFIVVGLVLLAMGTGYARLLARQDQPNPDRQFASGG